MVVLLVNVGWWWLRTIDANAREVNVGYSWLVMVDKLVNHKWRLVNVGEGWLMVGLTISNHQQPSFLPPHPTPPANFPGLPIMLSPCRSRSRSFQRILEDYKYEDEESVRSVMNFDHQAVSWVEPVRCWPPWVGYSHRGPCLWWFYSVFF